MDAIKVGNNIYTLRKNLKLSQAELGNKIGVTAQAISKWEKGESLPETYYLPILSQILGITIDELLMEDNTTLKSKGNIPLDNIVKGIDTIYNLKDSLGEDSLFYFGMIKGINDLMNLDFEYIYKSRKNILYVEAIIQMLHQGYSLDKNECENLFQDNYQTYLKIMKYDTTYWENIYLNKLNELK